MSVAWAWEDLKQATPRPSIKKTDVFFTIQVDFAAHDLPPRDDPILEMPRTGPCGPERTSLRCLAVADYLPTIKLVPAPGEAPFAAGLRLLLVEDDPSIRSTLAEMLSDEGYVVTTATHGRDALEMLRLAPAPDAIVLDLMMPVMDGWEFRIEQRADPLIAGIPLLAMSADLSPKARAIAADAYVRKPIDFPEMLRLLRDIVGRAARHRLATADRMAALGTLASGIAHEINNPLTYVIANLQTLADALPPPATRRFATWRRSWPTRFRVRSGFGGW